MFKKSLLVALLLSIITVFAVSEEIDANVTDVTESNITVNKCDVIYDECMEKCGDDATEECAFKCQTIAEECDASNTPAVEE